ncbi:unnamed protein product, partial [Onchocerca flexuosa]|uniref:PH domain-containing protein n=1 Tax=Onchocerca flexuosa TaxID=387005 RepID=A0A183HFI7_9BILA
GVHERKILVHKSIYCKAAWGEVYRIITQSSKKALPVWEEMSNAIYNKIFLQSNFVEIHLSLTEIQFFRRAGKWFDKKVSGRIKTVEPRSLSAEV